MPDAAADSDAAPLDGSCTCRAVRFRLRRRPLVVHCCHYRDTVWRPEGLGRFAAMRVRTNR